MEVGRKNGFKRSTMAAIMTLAATSIVAVDAWADAPARSVADVRSYVEKHRNEIVDQFVDLVAIQGVRENAPMLQNAADRISDLVRKRGLQVEQWQTSVGIPVVFAEKRVPGATKTILFYMHYDTEPAVAKDWQQPDPFKPVIRTESLNNGGKEVADLKGARYQNDWRIYARGASDDRAQIQAILSALDAIGSNPNCNIKLFFDGQEEAGGPGVREVVAKYPEKLKSDILVMLDGPQHPSGKPTIFYGTRGEAKVEVTVYTAKQALHSGNFGNFQPDANVRLSQLLTSMVDPSGKVLIKDFYADLPPFTAADKAMFAKVPDVSRSMQKTLGIGAPDGAAPSMQEGFNIPSFSIHTIKGGVNGNAIPASAYARIALRMVKENKREVMQRRIEDHVKAQGYFVVKDTPDLATLASHPKIAKVVFVPEEDPLANNAWRTDPENSHAKAITESLRSVWGNDLVQLRTLGATQPAFPFISGLGNIAAVGVPIANYDNNQHSVDENLRIGHLLDGIVTISAMLLK